MGGSWIYGKVNDKGEFTGHNVAYDNQDLKTIYVGTFENVPNGGFRNYERPTIEKRSPKLVSP